ncbi:hypothetical protein SBD_1771 [Streptomyces bottropensis ATCC 25435]|uniref:Uncharacterized protein n=1 Tax=Streptomyces bottropensis ATCC 25435 TaxID=1054862 RepID=M3FVC8_9ACTN|nr:hypothetical protein SBD_1771 [Streptomyces bottropensis ATCC 25435]
MQPRLGHHPPHHRRRTKPAGPRTGKRSVLRHTPTLRPPHRPLCRRPVGGCRPANTTNPPSARALRG